jgi:hypothetical protein
MAAACIVRQCFSQAQVRHLLYYALLRTQDGINEAEFTLGLLQEDGSEAVNTFTVAVNGATCSTYVAIYHKRKGELKWISISSKVQQALVIAHPIRIAKKAGKKHLL